MSFKFLLAAAALVAASLSPLSAATMQLVITGEVTFIESSLQNPTFAVNDSVTATYIYDPSTSVTGNAGSGSRQISSALFDINGATVLAQADQTGVLFGSSQFFAQFVFNATTDTFGAGLNLGFPPATNLATDASGTVLSRLNRLADPTVAAAFRPATFVFRLKPGTSPLGTCAPQRATDCEFTASVTSIQVSEVAAVPLPAGALLLIGALGALGVARRRARA